MKNIQTRTAAALFVFAGAIAPAYSQGRSQDHGGDRADRSQRQDQQRGQARTQESRPQAQTQRSGGSQYQQQDRRGGFQNTAQQERPQAQFGRQQETRQQRNFQQAPQQSFQSQRSAQPQPNYQPQRGFQTQQNYQSQRSAQPQQGFQAQQNFRPQQSFQSQQNYRQGQDWQRNDYRGGNSFGQFSSNNWQGDRRTWTQRGGYRGSYIPESRYYSSFGPGHYFRIRPEFYDGYPRFQYGGYSFQILDPWPDYWGDDWYDSDDVYIDYQNDGYYMYNNRYPGVGISVGIGF